MLQLNHRFNEPRNTHITLKPPVGCECTNMATQLIVMSIPDSEKLALAARLKEALAKEKVTRAKLAEKTGVSVQAVSKWLKLGTIARAHIPAISELLNVDSHWLLTGEGLPKKSHNYNQGKILTNPPPSNASFIENKDYKKAVPVLDAKGIADFVENGSYKEWRTVNNWQATTEEESESTFATVISGHSMQPDFSDGDTVFVNPELKPANGDYIIALRTSDKAVIFRQLIVESDGVKYIKATATGWPEPITRLTSDYKIVGRVIKHQPRARTL